MRKKFVEADPAFASITDVTASFANDTLSAFGASFADTIVFSRNAAGVILVNGGATPVTGGTPTVANTALIQAFGQTGDDVLALDEASGALPRANLFGGAGNDSVTGGSGADQLFGQAGNDMLVGRGGTDFLFGGTENDVLIGGDGDDQMFGESGDDRIIWNPGDDTDLAEGGDGTDTVEVSGGNGDELFTVTANGTRVRFDRLEPAPFALDIGTSERLVVNMNGGNDTFSATGNLAALIAVTVDGGTGNDTLLGSNGNDLLLGADGDDFVDGQQGNDTALLGAGNDVFQWDPGDGNDVIEGQSGIDRLLFNGSAAGEIMNLLANGERALFTRNIANIVMDLNDVETIDVRAFGGADLVTVNDLSGTDVTQIRVDLAAAGGVDDLAADVVQAHATGGADSAGIVVGPDGVATSGLAATTIVSGGFVGDRLVLMGLGGDDVLTTTGFAAIQFELDGGTGNDQLNGGSARDILTGGDGDDVLRGGDGYDQMVGGAGDDRIIWNPGDDTDLAEGGDGTDTVEVNGGNGDALFTITANGARVRFDRLDPAPFSLDIGTAERLVLTAGGGDDTVSATGNLAALIQITVDGGAGNDTLLGSNGADLLLGGDGDDFVDGQQGNDTALLGAGDDLFQWDPGDGSDVVEGQTGADRLLFNGSNAAEIMEVSASGGRALLTRNIANIVMDLNDVETIDIKAVGGADVINVNPLTGTDVRQVRIDLGGADAAADVVNIAGTAGIDQIILTGGPGQIAVQGLVAEVIVGGAEPTDRVRLALGGGNDVVNAGALLDGGAILEIDLGAGTNRVTGSQGADVVTGGDGVDTVAAGRGNDIALLGAGNDRFIWNSGDGNDLFEAGAGIDQLDLVGGAGDDVFALAPAGGRLVAFGIGGSVDTDDVERVAIIAGAGSDTISVGDLSGTDLPQVTIDLAGANPALADGASDFVSLFTGAGDAMVNLSGSGGTVFTSGLAGKLSIVRADASDIVSVNGGAGNDRLSAAGLSGVGVQLRGGDGNDMLTGSAGADQLDGGEGADIVIGGAGNDLAKLGNGDDEFRWAAGGGADQVEGQSGLDSLAFSTGALADAVSVTAVGSRVLVAEAGGGAVSAATIETINLAPLGGTDSIVIGHLGGTDVQRVALNLGATAAALSGDARVDRVTLEGSGINDVIQVIAEIGGFAVTGLGAVIGVRNADATDLFEIRGGSGNDLLAIDAGVGASAGQFLLDGGAGDDVMVGGNGNDRIIVGTGADTIDGGGGIDTVDYALAGGAVVVDLTLGLGAHAGDLGESIINIESVIGSAFADSLSGSAVAESLFGGAGNDVLAGLAGADDLRGDAGNDRLIGGAGADQLTGGLGGDRFTFQSVADSSGTARDTIRDFNRTESDRVDLTAIDANATVNGNNAFAFIGTGAFTGAAGQLRVTYGAGSAIVSGDVDGDRVADIQIILTGVTAADPLVSTDFFL
ncbi:Ca2+-binding RTX toxin-like protein [Sphingomonas zeicaulis]|uniref:beta strand repeat-containing protein n=1 Tax=Sphingomonas zeicaulis TaxID=1632740 RepID=UPI003D1E8F02